MKANLYHHFSLLAILLVSSLTFSCSAQQKLSSDRFTTPSGKSIVITFIKHASLVIDCDGYVIYIDPVARLDPPTDFSKMRKADAILITHEHLDHYDPVSIRTLSSANTTLVANGNVTKKLHRGTTLNNGNSTVLNNSITVKAVPAYNTTPDYQQYHPMNRDNGYILTFDNFNIYIAGDTEPIPFMDNLKNIDIAFLPVNQPYTMTTQQCINAAKTINPKILYPYHFSDTPVNQIVDALRGSKIDVRIRNLK